MVIQKVFLTVKGNNHLNQLNYYIVISIKSMEPNDHIDRLTEARSSFGEEQPTWLQSLFRKVCPCLISHNFVQEKSFQSKNQHTQGSIADKTKYINSLQVELSENSSAETTSANYQRASTNSSAYHSTIGREKKPSMVSGNQFLSRSSLKTWHSYPVYEFKENEIFVLGRQGGKMLAKISSVKTEPSNFSKQKSKKSRTNMKQAYEHMSTSILDRFWNQRYMFFQKFDEGIKIDEESWSTTTPEAVGEYLASKIRFETILDGFCGIGSHSIKLSNTCNHVISNDSNPIRLKFMLDNAKVYNVENIQSKNQNFLNIHGLPIDAVFLVPPLKQNVDTNMRKLQIKDFSPHLHHVINQAIKLTKNIILLLPPNTDIRSLGECISRESMKEGINEPFCSLKIEKIFFMEELKYLAVYMGPEAQTDIKLNDELSYIYELMKDKEKKGYTPKKLIKKLRQEYGMINVLNYAIESKKLSGETAVEKFYSFVRIHNLLPEEKLQKFIHQEKQQFEKKHSIHEDMVEIMEEEKYVDEVCTEGERTVSYYSNYSGRSSASRTSNQKVSESHSSYTEQPTSLEARSSLNYSFIQRANTAEFAPFNEEIKEEMMEESNRDEIMEQSHGEQQSHEQKQS